MHLVDCGHKEIQMLRVGDFIKVHKDGEWEQVLQIDWIHATARIIVGLGARSRIVARDAWYTVPVAVEVMD